MANQKPGTQRKISWKFLLLTSLLGLATLLVLFFPVLANLLPAVAGKILGIIGSVSTISAANKILNENLLALLTNSINALFRRIYTKLGLPGGQKGPVPPRAPVLEGPYDFAILYKAHGAGESMRDLIREALREKYLRRSSSEAAAIHPLPWSQPDEFASRWQDAIRAKRAIHDIIVISDDSLLREDGDGDVDLAAIRAHICERATKQSGLAHDNESQATLLFLNRAWEIDFYQKVGLPRNTLLSATMPVEQRKVARHTIMAIVPAGHCDIRERAGEPDDVAGPQSPSPTRVFNAPRGRNPFFIDRIDSEAGLLAMRQDTQLGKHVQILTGPVGSGKTQIALAFAHRHYQGDDGESVSNYSMILWLDARNSLEEGIKRLDADLTSRLGLSWVPPETIGDVFQWLQKQPVNKHWLLIIDRCKVTDFRTIESYLDRLQERGHVLLTLDGTFQNTPENASIKTIEYMREDMAANLLARKALNRPEISIEKPDSIRELRADLKAEKDIKKYWDEVRELVKVMGRNPLFINHAGAVMKGTGKRPRQYQEMYQRWFEASIRYLRDQEHSSREDLSDDRGRALSVWHISYSQIEDQIALKILRLCTFLSTERIPKEIISKCSGVAQELQEKALDELERRAILRRENYSGPFHHLYRLEKLVREIIHWDLYNAVTSINKLECQLEALLAVSAAFTEAIPQAPERYDYYRPHIGESVGYLEDEEMQAYLKDKLQEPSLCARVLQFLYTVGCYYREYPEKESPYRTDERRRRETKNVMLSSEHLFDLAMQLYSRWGSPDAAALGLEKITLAQYLYDIALFYHEEFLYRDNHKLEQALNWYCLAARLVQDLPVFHALFIDIHLNLGRLYSYRQEYARAEEHFACLLTAVPPMTQLQNAEIACSKATNQVFKAAHLQNPDAARQLYIDTYKNFHDILADLQKCAQNLSAREAQRAQILHRICRTARLVILMQRSSVRAEGEERENLESEIEKCLTAIEGGPHSSRQGMKALDYLQLISDMSTLAEAYRELAPLKWKSAAYLEKASHYSLLALGLFEEFGGLYPKKRRQGQSILQSVWEIYQQNNLFDKEEPRTRSLWEKQKELLPEVSLR
jgi:hypothetical protein